MTKEEFKVILTRKIDEAIKLREEAKNELIFYERLIKANKPEYEFSRKKAEEKLIRSRELIKNLQEIINLPVYEKIMNLSSLELESYRKKIVIKLEERKFFLQEKIESYKEELSNIQKELENNAKKQFL